MAMEPEEDKNKQLTDELVTFMKKRSEHDSPRYAARLKNYEELQHKRHRANAARRHSENIREKRGSSRKGDVEQKEIAPENTDHQATDDGGAITKRTGDSKCAHRSRSASRAASGAPSDACGRRRRRRRSCGRKRRRRSCRRRRRRRSCRRRRRRRRRSCRRRRRRSCRRRRRRSCSRRRRRRRRCRRC